MNTVPKDIERLSSTFKDSSFADDGSYWFSYKNLSGNQIDIFSDRLRFSIDGSIRDIELSKITSLRVGACDKSQPDQNEILIQIEGGDFQFKVDTSENVKDADIFVILPFLKRRIFLQNKQD